MNYTLATGSSVHQTVSLIMAAKPLDIILGQPTMDTMNKMVEQIAQMIAHKDHRMEMTPWISRTCP
jgi:hypothetical protein